MRRTSTLRGVSTPRLLLHAGTTPNTHPVCSRTALEPVQTREILITCSKFGRVQYTLAPATNSDTHPSAPTYTRVYTSIPHIYPRLYTHDIHPRNHLYPCDLYPCDLYPNDIHPRKHTPARHLHARPYTPATYTPATYTPATYTPATYTPTTYTRAFQQTRHTPTA